MLYVCRTGVYADRIFTLWEKVFWTIFAPVSCDLDLIPMTFIYKPDRGATTAEKLRGTNVWVPTLGRLRPAPVKRRGWVLCAGGGRPLPL